MRTRVILAALALCAATPAAASTNHTRPWRVGPLTTLNGPVSGLRCANDGTDTAPLLARDRRKPQHLFATYLTDNARAQVSAESKDGGRHWIRRAVKADTSCTGGPAAGLVDSGLVLDSDGFAVSSVGWVKTSPTPTDTNHDATRELTMTLAPRARQFRPPVDVESTQPDQRGYLTSHAGRLYLETERFANVAGDAVPGLGGIAILTSADHGTSWRLTRGQPMSSPPGHQPVAGGIAATGSHVVATWVDIQVSESVVPLLTGGPLPGVIRAATSSDGGRTWSAPVAIAAATSTLPRATAAPDGSILVTWEDAEARGAVHLARSVDFGATWKVKTVAPAGHIDYGITSVAGDPAGTIAVLHEQAVRSGPGQRFRVVLSISSDHGATWTAVPVSPVMDLASFPNPGSAFDSVYGAEEQVIAVPGGFVCAFPVFKPVHLDDGHVDVATAKVFRA